MVAPEAEIVFPQEGQVDWAGDCSVDRLQFCRLIPVLPGSDVAVGPRGLGVQIGDVPGLFSHEEGDSLLSRGLAVAVLNYFLLEAQHRAVDELVLVLHPLVAVAVGLAL